MNGRMEYGRKRCGLCGINGFNIDKISLSSEVVENMQHNKYLEDLGIPLKDIGTNFSDVNDKRKREWAREREIYGFDERETWAIDRYFVEWLYSHLMMYLDRTDSVIDLEFYKFKFESKEYTQKEAILFIVNACKNYLLIKSEYNEEYIDILKDVQRAIKLFADIFPAMWW